MGIQNPTPASIAFYDDGTAVGKSTTADGKDVLYEFFDWSTASKGLSLQVGGATYIFRLPLDPERENWSINLVGHKRASLILKADH